MATGATITLRIYTNHVTGPFVPGYELAEEIIGMLDGETLQPGDSEYEIIGVDEVERPEPPRKKAAGGAISKWQQPDPLKAHCPKCDYEGDMPAIRTTSGTYRAICPSCVTAYKIGKDGKSIATEESQG